MRGNRYPREADANGTGKGYRDGGCLALSESHVFAVRVSSPHPRVFGGLQVEGKKGGRATKRRGEEREYHLSRTPPLPHHQHNHTTRARVYPDDERRTCPTVATQLTRPAAPWRSLADRGTAHPSPHAASFRSCIPPF